VRQPHAKATLWPRLGQARGRRAQDQPQDPKAAHRRNLAFVACATVGVALAASKPLPLSARVIQPGEFPGFVAYRPPTLFKTPQQWVGPVGKGLTRAQASAQIARLRAEDLLR
jgi:hypothetical protein